MKKFIALFLPCLFLTAALCGQTPQLVSDYNLGQADSFGEYNYEGIQFGNTIILPLNHQDHGNEIGEIFFLEDSSQESSRLTFIFLFFQMGPTPGQQTW